MERMKIAIDIDGTLIDCDNFLYRISNKYLSSPTAKSNKKLRYSIIENENDDKDGLISNIIDRFTNMGKVSSYIGKEDSVSLVNAWHESGIIIYLLSSRPNFASLNRALREFFNKSNLQYSCMVVHCNNKAKFCNQFHIDLLIDNSPAICKSVEDEGTDTICLNSDANKKKKFQDLRFANDWRQIADIVSDIKLEKDKKV